MTRSPPAPTIPALRPLTNQTPTNSTDTGPTPLVPGPQPEPDLIDTQLLLEVLDGTVRAIFSVALTLSAARNLTNGPATTRLDQALDEIDDLVRELRHTALSAHLSTPTRAWAAVSRPPAHWRGRPPTSPIRPLARSRKSTQFSSGYGTTPLPTRTLARTPENPSPTRPGSFASPRTR